MPIPSISRQLFIVGPTGTGKTDLAVAISKKIDSLIISADSRQVYKGMDIVTGKDHPPDTYISGIDLVNPDQPCSVAVWHDAVMLDVEESYHFNKLPMYVGGTGLYLKSQLEPFPTMGIGIDNNLRRGAEKKTVEELQAQLRTLSPDKFYSMNNSDVHNPRRLVRAIEVAQFNKAQLRPSYIDRPNKNYQLIVGLRYANTIVYEKMMRQRVEKRLKAGAVEETKRLLIQYDRHLPSMTAIGYKSIIQYIEGQLNEEQMINRWVIDELNYAKRQMTWFKKVADIQWFEAGTVNLATQVAELVNNWYD